MTQSTMTVFKHTQSHVKRVVLKNSLDVPSLMGPLATQLTIVRKRGMLTKTLSSLVSIAIQSKRSTCINHIQDAQRFDSIYKV